MALHSNIIMPWEAVQGARFGGDPVQWSESILHHFSGYVGAEFAQAKSLACEQSIYFPIQLVLEKP